MTLYYFAAYESKAIPGYWDGVMASSTMFLVFAAPFASVAAAADANRLRRSSIDWVLAVRGPLTILWDTCKYPVLFAFVIQLYAFGLASYSSIGLGGPSPSLLPLAWLTVIVLHAITGYIIGRALPMAAALPVSILVSFVPMTFAWSSSIVPLRYFAGLALSQCCDVGAQLSNQAVWTTITFSIAVTAALLMVALSRSARLANRAVRLAAAAALLTIAFVNGFASSNGLGPFPAEARSSAALRCDGTSPVICLYPEQLWKSNPRQMIRSAVAKLDARGLPIPATINGNPNISGESSVGMVYRPSMGQAQLNYALAAGYVNADHRESCYEQPNVEAWQESVSLATDVVLSVLDPASATQLPSALRADEIMNLSEGEFQNAVTALLAEARDCENSTLRGSP